MSEATEYAYGRGYTDGAFGEKRRIVYLLEAQKDKCAYWSAIKHDWPEDHDAACEECRPINKLIALVKGEVNVGV